MRTAIATCAALLVAVASGSMARADHYDRIERVAGELMSQSRDVASELRRRFRHHPRAAALMFDASQIYTHAAHTRVLALQHASRRQLHAEVHSLDQALDCFEDHLHELDDHSSHDHLTSIIAPIPTGSFDTRRLRFLTRSMKNLKREIHDLVDDLPDRNERGEWDDRRFRETEDRRSQDNRSRFDSGPQTANRYPRQMAGDTASPRMPAVGSEAVTHARPTRQQGSFPESTPRSRSLARQSQGR